MYLFDARAAQQWYAQHSQLNWKSGSISNPMGWGLAVLQDMSGGLVSSVFGSPASGPQAIWGIGFGVAFGEFGKVASICSALSEATDSIFTTFLTGGQQQVSADFILSATLSTIGLGGELAGQIEGQVLTGFALGAQVGKVWFIDRSSNQAMTDISKQPAKSTQPRPVPQSTKKTDIPPSGPPPPPDKSPTAAVGGILFKQCAALLTELGGISGAYWDAVTGSLVLIGRDSANNDAVRLRLPTMDRDHLAVALRASLAGQAIGVSIDPESKYRDGIMHGVTPPDGTPMLVSYLGNTEGTLFGAIMFEADRLLKCLDKGIDNESKKPLSRTVPGFKPLLEMIYPGDGRPQNVWHRFWFVIDRVELKHDPGSGAIAFGDVRLKVLNEIEMDGQAKERWVDPADEAFVRHLTEHYDDYAQTFPILARLKELAKVAAVANFLVNQEIALDIETIVSPPPIEVETPDSTLGIAVTGPNVEVRHEGNVVHTRTVSLFGGVDIDADPRILPDDGTARRLKEMAELSRPSPRASSWTFGKNGSASRALASRIGQSRIPFRRFCDDHCFLPGGDEGSLRLQRLYDSSTLHRGDFGPGWSLWVPFSISVIAPSGKRPEVMTQKELDERRERGANPVLVLHDRKAARSDIYRFVKDYAAFCRVTSQTRSKAQTSFKYDPSDCIAKKGDCFMLARGSCLYLFDGRGQLLEVRKGNICLARYVRKDSRIVRIADGSNRSYDVWYEESEAARIAEVIPSSGPSIAYSYDRRGLLVACDNDKSHERYGYDSNGLLTEVKGHSGKVISRAVYGQFGDLVNAQSDVVTDWTGGRVVRSLERGKVVSLGSESGGIQILGYGDQGELAEIQMGDRVTGMCRLRYDANGRLTGFRDPFGHTVLLHHDESGRVTRCVGPRGDSRTFEFNEAGRLASVADQDGNKATLEYDRDGNLSRTKGPGNIHLDYKYAGGILVKIQGPAGDISVRPRKDTLETKAVASGGLWQKAVWDRYGRLVHSQSHGSKPVRFEYDDDGEGFCLLSESGTVQYQANNKELTVDVVFK